MELTLILIVSLPALGYVVFSFANNLKRDAGVKASLARPISRGVLRLAAGLVVLAILSPAAMAQRAATPPDAHGAGPSRQAVAHRPGGEANLILPDLSRVEFLGLNGRTLLMLGLGICFLGLLFGLLIFINLKNRSVHHAMREISELIYETCKTYLITQGKFILILEAFIAAVIVLYFGFLVGFDAGRVLVILLFSLIGIGGSYGVAWFGIRVNTFANSRTAFASLEGKPYPIYSIPLKAGMSIGMLLISVVLLIMLAILLFVPRDYAGPVFIGFAIGESSAPRRCASRAASSPRSRTSAAI